MESPVYNKKYKKGINELTISYPNLYYGGVYCLAPLILYNIVNQLDNWICYRHFLDEGEIKGNLIGFSLQYELDYNNVLKILEKNNISLDKTKRKQIIFAGGPCVNSNPYALQEYLDFMFIGEVEESLPKVLNVYENTKDKQEFLEKISVIPGVYVPNITKEITRAEVNLENAPYPLIQPFPDEINKKFVFGEVFMLEIERGCPFNCKFCQMPFMYNKTKIRSLEKIKNIIDEGIKINKRNKVIIYSPSFSHPNRKDILQYIIDKGLEFSVPSLKAEYADRELLDLIKKGGQKTLTIAPESSEELRKKIGKNITDEQFIKFLELAKDFEAIKMYFMIGLPGEDGKDILDLIKFVCKAKEKFRNLHVSVNAFIPKPNTEFSKHHFDKAKIIKFANLIKKEFNKNKIKYKIDNINSAYTEWKISHAKRFPL